MYAGDGETTGDVGVYRDRVPCERMLFRDGTR